MVMQVAAGMMAGCLPAGSCAARIMLFAGGPPTVGSGKVVDMELTEPIRYMQYYVQYSVQCAAMHMSIINLLCVVVASRMSSADTKAPEPHACVYEASVGSNLHGHNYGLECLLSSPLLSSPVLLKHCCSKGICQGADLLARAQPKMGRTSAVRPRQHLEPNPCPFGVEGSVPSHCHWRLQVA